MAATAAAAMEAVARAVVESFVVSTCSMHHITAQRTAERFVTTKKLVMLVS